MSNMQINVNHRLIEALDAILSLILQVKMGFLFLSFLVLYIWAAVWLSCLGDAEVFNNPLETFWWFVVTVTTVGYGDMSPSTLWGKYIVGIPVIIFGIALYVSVGAKAAEAILNKIAKKRRGEVEYTNLRGQLQIIGYHSRSNRTRDIIDQIFADTNREDRPVQVFADNDEISETPFDSKVVFSRGKLNSKECMRFARTDRADCVFIDGKDDAETFMITVAVLKINACAHIVVAVYDMKDGMNSFMDLSDRIECVPAERIPLIVQAIQDPGTTKLVTTLITNDDGNEFYRYDIVVENGSWRWLDLDVFLKIKHNATLVAIAENHACHAPVRENMPWDYKINSGMSIFYIAKDRIHDFSFEDVREVSPLY